jgi:hypothetical protein
MAEKPGTIDPQELNTASAKLISTVAYGELSAGAPDPPRAAIQKFAELDLQAAEKWGGVPNKQLMQLAASDRKNFSAVDVFKAGELMARDVNAKAPTTNEALGFFTSSNDALQPKQPASKFMSGHADGMAASQAVVSATKYAAGFIQGLNDDVSAHFSAYRHELGDYLSETWSKPGGGWQILKDAEQKVESAVRPTVKTPGLGQ